MRTQHRNNSHGRKFVQLVLSGLLLVALLASCSSPQQPTRQLKFSVVTSADSSLYKGAAKFAELVLQRTRGRIIVTLYPDAQLAGGNQVKELEMLSQGQIDFTFHSNLLYSTLDNKFSVISLPWLFDSYADVDKFLAGPAGKLLFDAMPPLGMVGLGYAENGFRQITNSKREIKTPDDLQGLKIRVPNAPMYLSLFKSFGAEPVTMSFAGVYKALEEKAVDGQENPVDLIASSKLYQVQNYVTLWNYSYDVMILGVNQELFKSLDQETQDILRQAAVEACAYEIQVAREAFKTRVDFLKSKNMKVTELTPAEIAAFRSLTGPVYEEYEPLLGSELMDQVHALGR